VTNGVDVSDFSLDHRAGLPTFLVAPAPRLHAVQFYEEESFLLDTVGKFLGAGLAAGDRISVIATRKHTEGFLARLDTDDVEQARASGRITILDAEVTLKRLMVDGLPDRSRFRDILAEVMPSESTDTPKAPLRAYGEMVDLLAKSGNVLAAIRLEEFWHEVLQENAFSMLCSYGMGAFFQPGDSDRMMDVCNTHTHVIPTERFVGLAGPGQRMREVALLQQRDRMLRKEVERREKFELALDDALRNLGKLEKELQAWVMREQDARHRAEASDAFKKRFLGILGHDLRNPLNTILTTVRMMALRKELQPDSHARLERVVASSVRMQRMIEQLLEVARAQRPDGIEVQTSEPRDLAPLVRGIVSEVGASSPSRTIELVTSPTFARVDVERFEQAMWSLLCYLVAHAEAESAVLVDVGRRDKTAVIGIETRGMLIERAHLPHLFDSFHIESQPEAAMDGVALGLHLAKCIVTAHGGKVDARSSEETGTRLEAILPLA
jgi:signal transduction histidine kinase